MLPLGNAKHTPKLNQHRKLSYIRRNTSSPTLPRSSSKTLVTGMMKQQLNTYDKLDTVRFYTQNKLWGFVCIKLRLYLIVPMFKVH